jgi:hypothetical protein
MHHAVVEAQAMIVKLVPTLVLVACAGAVPQFQEPYLLNGCHGCAQELLEDWNTHQESRHQLFVQTEALFLTWKALQHAALLPKPARQKQLASKAKRLDRIHV